MKTLLAIALAVLASGLATGSAAAQPETKKPNMTCLEWCQMRKGIGSRSGYSKCMSRCASNRAERAKRRTP